MQECGQASPFSVDSRCTSTVVCSVSDGDLERNTCHTLNHGGSFERAERKLFLRFHVIQFQYLKYYELVCFLSSCAAVLFILPNLADEKKKDNDE